MIFRSLASPDPVRHSKRRRRRRRKKKKEEKKKKKRKKRKKQNYICTLPIDRPWRKFQFYIYQLPIDRHCGCYVNNNIMRLPTGIEFGTSDLLLIY